MDNKFELLMLRLEEAYKNNDIEEINKVNSMIMGDLEVTVSESTLDYEFIESIKGKTVYKNLSKFLKEGSTNKNYIMKMLSSLVTHLIIESDVRNKNIDLYPVKVLNSMVDKLVSSEVSLEDVQKYLHDRFGRFI